ncbi:MAG: TonB-dependent receptor domain-containing protein [Flavobacteriaceae bacterium]
MKLIKLIFCALLPVGLWAQSFELSGTVKDVDGRNISFANVVLLNVADSSQVKGSLADETGRFIMSDVKPSLYFLQARYFGYTSRLIPLDIQNDVRIGALFMEEDQVWLDEVVVTARQPTVERRADRLVFNVENTIVSQGNTWDILRNTPGVINVQGQLEVRGQRATIYLNDRKVQLSQTEVQNLLESLTGSAIASIEVLTNPSARYDAEGGPILNIITTKNIIPGYKGSVQGNYTQAVFPKYSLGTSHYFKNNKLNLFGNYTINPRKDFKDVASEINYINDLDEVFAGWDTQLDRTTRSQSQQANLILDYDLDEQNRLNLTSNLTYSPNKKINDVVDTEMRNGQNVLDSTLNTMGALRNDYLNLGFDLNYEHDLNKKDGIIKANVHYTHFDEDQGQEGSSNYFDPDGNFIRNFSFSTDAKQDIDIITGQVDLSLPLGETSLETGIKLSSIQTDSRIDYFDVNGTQPPFDIVLSDIFQYDETVWAAYGGISRNWEKWSLKVGLRGEHTHVESLSITLDSLSTQDYFELFPSLYILHRIDEDHSIALDYSRKLRRPNYRDLNPFRYFLNENDFREGNPNLRPNFSHNFNFNYTFKDTYFFDIYYRDNGNYISRLTFQDNNNQTLRQAPQNVLESVSYGVDLTMGKSLIPIWYFYAYTSVFYEDETFLALESQEESYTNKVSGFYGYMANYITLSKDKTFTGELALTYFNRFLYGSYILGESFNLNIGFQKSLWNKKAVISLVAEDIFGKVNPRYTSRYFNQDNSYLSKPETQFIRLGFTFNFGNYGLLDNKRNLNKIERDRLENE